MTVSVGVRYLRAIQCADDGTLNRYVPSPTRETTVRSGEASLAQTAPPPDQPREPPPDPINDPGLLTRRCSATTWKLVTASVSTSASSPASRSRTHAVRYCGVITPFAGRSSASQAARCASC